MTTSSLGAEETKVDIPIQERVRKNTERLKAGFSKLDTKIHRFPPGLREINKRYIVPSFVALGPYHHNSKDLQHTEEVKHAAAHYFCEESGRSIEDVYDKILSIAAEARSCYADDVVANFTEAEFAVMMFLDGCYLLHYMSMNPDCPLLLNRMTLSTGPCMLRDIFLLENQLPWLVLEALMTFMSVPVYEFVVGMAHSFDTVETSALRLSEHEFWRHRPQHLLGLLRYYLKGNMPEETKEHLTLYSLSSSAIELAEIGIELSSSNNTWFADMSVQTDHLFGQLSLTPVFLNDFTACWLANMAAFEACMSTRGGVHDGFHVSSYISLLAMLMDKEEDVHELRAKHLIHSFFSNQEVLDLFKVLARHMRLGHRYFVITEKIEMFKRHRRVRIAVHRLIYNNFKIIVALFSIASVLVGIFRTLMSLKQHQQ